METMIDGKPNLAKSLGPMPKLGEPAPDFEGMTYFMKTFRRVSLEVPGQVAGPLLLPSGLHLRLPNRDQGLQREGRRLQEDEL